MGQVHDATCGSGVATTDDVLALCGTPCSMLVLLGTRTPLRFPRCRLRSVAKRVGRASTDAVHGSFRQRARRPRFPTVLGRHDRRRSEGVEMPAQRGNPAGRRLLRRTGQVPGGDGAAAARVPAISVRQSSAGHIIVERTPPGGLLEEEPPAAQPEPRPPQRLTVEVPERPPVEVLPLSPVREASVEAMTPPSLSTATTPNPKRAVAAAAGPSAAASPSQSSDAQLLTDVPLSSAAPGVAGTAAAPGVAGGRVAKRGAGPTRFARALACFDCRKDGASRSSGPPPAPSAGAGAATTADAASANASPSMDSRASSGRGLLSDRVRRSDLLGEAGSEARPEGRSPQRGSTGDEGTVVGLEAVPEGSPSGEQAAAALAAAVLPRSPYETAALPSGTTTTSPAAPAPEPASPTAGFLSRLSPRSPRWGRRKTSQHAEEAAAAAAAATSEVEAGEGSPRRELLRAAFDAWRMHCADAAWRRHDRRESFAGASPRSEASDGTDDVQGGCRVKGQGESLPFVTVASAIPSATAAPASPFRAAVPLPAANATARHSAARIAPQCAPRRCCTLGCTTRCRSVATPACRAQRD